MKRVKIIVLSLLCVFITVLATIPANAKEDVYKYDKNTRTLTINIQGKIKE